MAKSVFTCFQILKPEQMSPIPSSNRSLDIALPMRILRVLGDALFKPSTQENWPRDGKLTQSWWCLHWFLSLRADVWKNLLQVHIGLVVRQVWIEKMFNKNIEIAFRNAVFCLCQRALVPLLCSDERPESDDLYSGLGKTRQSTSYNFSCLQYYVQFWLLLGVMRE